MSEIVDAADIRIRVDGIGGDAARALLARRADKMRGLSRAGPRSGRTALSFTIDGTAFALPVEAVAAVLPPAPTVRVPGAPADLVGISVRRGRIVNVVDPSRALGVEAARPDGHMLLLRDTAPRLALLVDRAEDIVRLIADEQPSATGLTAQVARLDGGGHVALIDRDLLIAAFGLAIQRTGG